ncbi:hypothetical protein V6N11_068298 [Hibiscus sabdariffa]|uniref:Uncharacterized protein n=2 Tax=Hibiscus sabdariffa TaxID=183260 RepID=A0ABR2A125_9ROSI
MAPVSSGAHSFRPSSLFQASTQRSYLFLFHRLELLLEKIVGRLMEVATPDDPRLFLRCSYEVESMLCLSSLSTANGNIVLVFLAASDDCVLAVKILSSDVCSTCSPRFRRLCSYVGEGDPFPTLELSKKLFNDQRLVALALESNVTVLFI